jgi:hypothetical protein
LYKDGRGDGTTSTSGATNVRGVHPEW